MNDSALPFMSEHDLPKTPQRTASAVIMDNLLRRALDIIVSVLVLIFLIPVFILISSKIRHDSPGPIFYRGPRLGLHGKPFGILKFRTMWEKPDSHAGSRVTAQDDPRITPFGRWLRDTKLNELPQFWNVLVGQMSLVGPRPEDPTLALQWTPEVRASILSVRPGITSPATVLFRDEETRLHTSTVMDDYLRAIMPSKLRLDMLYVANRTLLTDLDVLFWTLIVLLPALKNRTVPQAGLYYGPIVRFTSRYLTWFLADSIVAFIAIGTAGILWRSTGPLDIGIIPSILMAMIMALLFSILNVLVGLNEVQWSRAPASSALTLAITTAAGIAIFYFINERYNGVYHLPRALLVFAGLLAMAGFIAIRYRERLMTGLATGWMRLRTQAGAVGERVLLVGAGQNSQVASWFFAQSKLSRAFSIIGIVDDDVRKQGVSYDGYRVIGLSKDIPALVEKFDVGILIYTITNISPENRQRIISICQSTKTLVVILPDVIGIFQRQFKVANTSYINGNERTIAGALYDLNLSELETLAERGDLAALKARLTTMRQENQREGETDIPHGLNQ